MMASEEWIRLPGRRCGKSIEQAMIFTGELKKLPKNKIFGISHVGYNSFILYKEAVITREEIRKEIENINVAMEYSQDEHDEMAFYYYKAQITILKRLLKRCGK